MLKTKSLLLALIVGMGFCNPTQAAPQEVDYSSQNTGSREEAMDHLIQLMTGYIKGGFHHIRKLLPDEARFLKFSEYTNILRDGFQYKGYQLSAAEVALIRTNLRNLLELSSSKPLKTPEFLALCKKLKSPIKNNTGAHLKDLYMRQGKLVNEHLDQMTREEAEALWSSFASIYRARTLVDKPLISSRYKNDVRNSFEDFIKTLKNALDTRGEADWGPGIHKDINILFTDKQKSLDKSLAGNFISAVVMDSYENGAISKVDKTMAVASIYKILHGFEEDHLTSTDVSMIKKNLEAYFKAEKSGATEYIPDEDFMALGKRLKADSRKLYEENKHKWSEEKATNSKGFSFVRNKVNKKQFLLPKIDA